MFKAKIIKVGNSAGVLIPTKVLKENNLNFGDVTALEFVSVIENIEGGIKEIAKIMSSDVVEKVDNKKPEAHDINGLRKKISSITSGNSRKPKMQVDEDYSLVSEDSI